MGLNSVKRIASRIMKIGESKIKIKPEDVPKASEALTADDIRSLIKEGIVYKLTTKSVSRSKARKKHLQVKKGRRRGRGSQKGGATSKVSSKTVWIQKVRTLRNLLKELYGDGLMDSLTRKKVYYMIKGNMFKSKNAMMLYLNEHEMLKEGSSEAKPKKVTKKAAAKTKKRLAKTMAKEKQDNDKESSSDKNKKDKKSKAADKDTKDVKDKAKKNVNKAADDNKTDMKR